MILFLVGCAVGFAVGIAIVSTMLLRLVLRGDIILVTEEEEL